MGYYVNLKTDQSEFFLAKENFAEAYEAMVKLNDLDHMKRGGSWGGEGISKDDERPAGMDHHPARWFSWMQSDYPNHYKTTPEILEGLGFQLSYDADGNINGLNYDDKTGQEDLFIGAIAHLVRDGSRLVWQGEDGTVWAYMFNGKEMLTLDVPLEYAIQKVLDEKMQNLLIKSALEEL